MTVSYYLVTSKLNTTLTLSDGTGDTIDIPPYGNSKVPAAFINFQLPPTSSATVTAIQDDGSSSGGGSVAPPSLIGSVCLPFNDTTTALSASATYTGTSRDIGQAVGTAQPWAYFTATFLADQTGTAQIAMSNDSEAWYVVGSSALAANTPLIMSVPVTTRYYRVQLVNGSTQQGMCVINSNFSAT